MNFTLKLVNFLEESRQVIKTNLTIKNCYNTIEKKDIESSLKREDLHIFVY